MIRTLTRAITRRPTADRRTTHSTILDRVRQGRLPIRLERVECRTRTAVQCRRMTPGRAAPARPLMPPMTDPIAQHLRVVLAVMREASSPIRGPALAPTPVRVRQTSVRLATHGIARRVYLEPARLVSSRVPPPACGVTVLARRRRAQIPANSTTMTTAVALPTTAATASTARRRAATRAGSSGSALRVLRLARAASGALATFSRRRWTLAFRATTTTATATRTRTARVNRGTLVLARRPVSWVRVPRAVRLAAPTEPGAPAVFRQRSTMAVELRTMPTATALPTPRWTRRVSASKAIPNARLGVQALDTRPALRVARGGRRRVVLSSARRGGRAVERALPGRSNVHPTGPHSCAPTPVSGRTRRDAGWGSCVSRGLARVVRQGAICPAGVACPTPPAPRGSTFHKREPQQPIKPATIVPTVTLRRPMLRSALPGRSVWRQRVRSLPRPVLPRRTRPAKRFPVAKGWRPTVAPVATSRAVLASPWRVGASTDGTIRRRQPRSATSCSTSTRSRLGASASSRRLGTGGGRRPTPTSASTPTSTPVMA